MYVGTNIYGCYCILHDLRPALVAMPSATVPVVVVRVHLHSLPVGHHQCIQNYTLYKTLHLQCGHIMYLVLR